jgi:LmbE family N-acetylglucosaminyl deacetylase
LTGFLVLRFWSSGENPKYGHELAGRVSHRRGMVVPLCAQEEWMPVFDGLPEFEPGERRVVLISPHPDDETLAAGGLIQALRERGVPVTLVAVTDGECAYAPVGDARLAEVRTVEQMQAAERLGVGREEVVRLHLPDSDVRAKKAELLDRLRPYVTAEAHVIAPWPKDFHPDHEVCGEVAKELAERTGALLTFYVFWTWHRGTPETLRGLTMEAFSLTAEQQAGKAEALGMHASQLGHASGDPILHEEHLWPARLPFEVYLRP